MTDLKQYQDFYDPHFATMQKVMDQVLRFLAGIKEQDTKIYEYCIHRIKSPESMKQKLLNKELEVTSSNALLEITDGVGIRIICAFLDDVYAVVDQIKSNPEWQLLKNKDYIAKPKPNGYRSYHLVILVDTDTITIPVEIQIRTISQDSWANLEHQMKYKKEITNRELIQQELKRCADEFASTDVSMQTIRELIMEFDSE